jgi:hypothetical protein
LTEDEIMNECQEAWQKERSADKSRVVILPSGQRKGSRFNKVESWFEHFTLEEQPKNTQPKQIKSAFEVVNMKVKKHDTSNTA